jgi:hypothetical protein
MASGVGNVDDGFGDGPVGTPVYAAYFALNHGKCPLSVVRCCKLAAMPARSPAVLDGLVVAEAAATGERRVVPIDGYRATGGDRNHAAGPARHERVEPAEASGWWPGSDATRLLVDRLRDNIAGSRFRIE